MTRGDHESRPPDLPIPVVLCAIVLGTSNLPGNTSGAATSVVNIFSIESSTDYVAGWIYTTENGQQFFEGNANALPTLDAFANILTVGLSSALLNAVNNPTAQTPANMQAIISADSTNGFKQHNCFSGPLPSSDFG